MKNIGVIETARLPLEVPQEERFRLLVDFGVITVPFRLERGAILGLLKARNHLRFYKFDYRIRDENFRIPELLLPGSSFHARAWEQTGDVTVSSEACLEFLSGLGAALLGPYGIALLFEQRRARFIKGYKCLSFMKKDELPLRGKEHDVPIIEAMAEPKGLFSFFPGTFEGRWNSKYLLLSFNEI